MQDLSNRTVVCSVLFLDIVEYSKKPVVEQLALKKRFNELLTAATEHVAASDRIILDTGDGAAISFLANPEDCLFAALALRDAALEDGALPLRMGINLGPVRLLKDINGQLNIIGDGINVAQRIMGFAEPGTVLVSRSYYEVVSCLSEDLLRLFRYEGIRKDKHVREHSVYMIAPGTPSLSRPSKPHAAPPAGHAASGRNLWMTMAAVLVFAAGTLAVLLRAPGEKKTAPDTSAVAQKSRAPAAEAAATPPPAGNKPALLSVHLSILPWGEVYIDGKKAGISPPLKNLSLPPGSHHVEVRNSTFRPYTTTIDGKAGGKITIQHKF
jgi:class 3 adenylate cyclase